MAVVVGDDGRVVCQILEATQKPCKSCMFRSRESVCWCSVAAGEDRFGGLSVMKARFVKVARVCRIVDRSQGDIDCVQVKSADVLFSTKYKKGYPVVPDRCHTTLQRSCYYRKCILLRGTHGSSQWKYEAITGQLLITGLLLPLA